jgi:hypothetical protein
MRTHFISRLALLLVSAFLVLTSQVWASGTIEWIFIVGGGVMILLSAAGIYGRNAAQRSLDGLVALLGAWSVVEAIIFDGSTLEWVSLVTGLVGVLFAVVGLGLHEMTTERVVHELSVTNGAGARNREGELIS